MRRAGSRSFASGCAAGAVDPRSSATSQGQSLSESENPMARTRRRWWSKARYLSTRIQQASTAPASGSSWAGRSGLAAYPKNPTQPAGVPPAQTRLRWSAKTSKMSLPTTRDPSALCWVTVAVAACRVRLGSASSSQPTYDMRPDHGRDPEPSSQKDLGRAATWLTKKSSGSTQSHETVLKTVPKSYRPWWRRARSAPIPDGTARRAAGAGSAALPSRPARRSRHTTR